MPRQSRSRPAARPAPPPAPKTQTRSASTTAAPPMQAPLAPVPHPGAAAATGGGGPGLLSSMAATAGSVAMGSVVGHGLSSMLFGGSRSAEAAEQPAAQPAQPQQQAMSCDFQAKQLTTCLESGDVQTCAWYIEQLKSCQAAARPY
ncbi:hypothetical protein Clacol_000735 [Clathrus columnatus]|uniref:Uncharacterized protein n=1 Tax=Clathrus columnatus TaxID=1419009 RepID=A0AAV4ZZ91_9AGAM|nr:hypothetical protein Clacol_000735 [Clathrus columnatus]